jgi:hypothetical protein
MSITNANTNTNKREHENLELDFVSWCPRFRETKGRLTVNVVKYGSRTNGQIK